MLEHSNNILPNGEEVFQFEKFAAEYPHAAFELDAEKFCNYVRANICQNLSNNDIEKFLRNDEILQCN